MARTLRSLVLVAAMWGLAAPAPAQPPAGTNVWTHGTTINVFAGATRDASKTSGVLGGAFGWEITPQIGVEASGRWIDRGQNSDAFAADLMLQAGLTHPHGAVPFVEAGVGFFRASFGAGAVDVPPFYSRRMGPSNMLGARRVFTDPSFTVGGGVNVYLTPHLAVRPAVDATFVTRGGYGHDTLAAFTVHVAYHFEPHPLMSRK
jgi:Outer membrane protein beta-barrel domain